MVAHRALFAVPNGQPPHPPCRSGDASFSAHVQITTRQRDAQQTISGFVLHGRQRLFGNSNRRVLNAFGPLRKEQRYCQELCSEECGSGGVSELVNSVGEDLPFEEGEDQGGGIEFAPVL